VARRRTVVVGDSLGVGTVPYLQRALGGPVRADVRVGRSSSDGVNALSRLLRGGADQVVLDLGTNDGSAQQLRQSVRRAQSLAGNRPIYIPTVNGPGAAQKNAMLRRLAGGNVHLVNWAGQSRGLVGGDGIHASGRGYQQRAQIVAHSINRADAASSAPTNGGTMAFQDIRLRRRDPLLAHIISGGGLSSGGLQDVARRLAGDGPGSPIAFHPDAHGNVTNIPPGSNLKGDVLNGQLDQPGSLADDGRPESSVLLGTGMKAGGLGRAPVQYKRSVVRRHGKLLEAHSYGPGTETRYFERKNPAVLQAAAAQAAQQQTGAPVTPASGLSPRDEELLKMLLGNPSLHR
jgi:hypothetical protein